MRTLKHTIAVTAFGLRSIPRRLGNSLVIVIGIAGVVAVLISVLAMSTGFQRTVRGDARSDRAIVLVEGADSESSSALSRTNVATIEAAPGIARDSSGKPLVSAEALLVAPVARKQNGADAYITLRGVGAQHFKVRPEIRLVAGRLFEPGLREVIVGEAAQTQFAGLDLGNVLRLHDGEWTIVGVFAGGDNVRESEVMADAQTVLSSYKLDAFNSASIMLEAPGALADFEQALRREPGLNVQVYAEPAYLAMVSRSINRLLRLVAFAIGGIMSIGALFGALNTMYSAVVARTTEIATLRAIGFGSTAVLASILIEALLLAAAGAGIGVTIAYLAFDGRAISTLGGARWDAQVVYALTITPDLVVMAIALACGIGLAGALLPAMRAARASVTDALRMG
jgi:putative ABC transport system permease protein